jgi:RNA polymerase sigma-70 factor, ECF subfamily
MSIRPFSALSLLFTRTDEEAMGEVKHHDDHRAFAQLVARWEQPIWRLCTRLTGDPHRGEDLKQETFSRLFEKRKDYQASGRFSSYLWRIALNLCHDELRRQQRRREFLPSPQADQPSGGVEDSPANEPTPDLQAAGLEEGELVRQALLQLPEIYRSVLVLRHYEQMKLAKIAEILEVPEGTVYSRMAEALTRLSRLLEPVLGPDHRMAAGAPNGQLHRPGPQAPPERAAGQNSDLKPASRAAAPAGFWHRVRARRTPQTS